MSSKNYYFRHFLFLLCIGITRKFIIRRWGKKRTQINRELCYTSAYNIPTASVTSLWGDQRCITLFPLGFNGAFCNFVMLLRYIYFSIRYIKTKSKIFLFLFYLMSFNLIYYIFFINNLIIMIFIFIIKGTGCKNWVEKFLLYKVKFCHT